MVNYPIEFTWEKSPDIPDEDTSLTVFNKGNVMPSTKILTFYRKQPFDLEARYAKPDMLPGKTNPWIGRFSVKGVKADASDDFMICKLKARLNLHGILNVEQGYYVEDQEIEEPIPEPKEGEKKDENVSRTAAAAVVVVVDSPLHPSSDVFDHEEASARPAKRLKVPYQIPCAFVSDALPSPPATRNTTARTYVDSFTQAMDTTPDANGSAEQKPKTRKIKKQVRKGDLPLSAGTASMDQAAKDAAAEKENQMAMEDKLVADTEDKKNELETYIYELRGKIDDQYAEHASEDEKTKLKEKLEQSEDWLYDEGEDATKATYVAKIEEIRAVAGPIVQRYKDKLQEEMEAVQRAKDEELAKKKAEEDARKKEQEPAKKEEANGDAEMKDVTGESGADGVKPDEVEEK
ncbi:hypothetical protein LTS18_005632 [Coniosporium uncinatum]|uniref:Uncharacterized protein n=1 Tax=Coniosporium uncinatum TaxID=93489 RepID=A0ACC3D4F1_9PEZI|nr:hypothetical protein LTS18_005632 [Coniosporium uncinatum]